MIIMLFAQNINADQAESTVPIQSHLTLRAPRSAAFTPLDREISRTELYRQEPDPVGATGVACQLDSVYPFEADFTDDIEPTGGGWCIDSVTSWWQNWSFTSWYAVPYINFIVYADSGTNPPQPVDSPFVEVMVDQSAYSATVIGNNQWIVEMKLPEEITLVSGQRHWIEVQPANVFTSNGQTGWMCNVGIGNGQEGYSRFPLLGYDVWTASSVVHGQAFEAGFVLYGSENGGAEVTWDFEDGTWQGWTHTNGLAYPAGWDVIGAGTVNWPPPDMGSYLLALDDDAAGSGTSVIDTAISPIFTEFAGDWLYWGVGYNNIGSDWVDVVIAYYDGSWNYDLVKHYTTDQGGYYYGVWDS
ncbi:MAG: hypothetical protein JSW02_06685, partial [candidate division WOR-3 bacterium]